MSIVQLRQLIRKFLLKEIPNFSSTDREYLNDIDICTDVLIYAELRGNNQGVVKLLSNALRGNPKATAIGVKHETSNSAKVDGGQRIGMCVISKAVDIAIDKASKVNIGIVGCSNYSSATGAIGYWAKKIATAGHIGIVMSQCNYLLLSII